MIVTPAVSGQLRYRRALKKMKKGGWKEIYPDATWRQIFVILDINYEPHRIEFATAGGTQWARAVRFNPEEDYPI